MAMTKSSARMRGYVLVEEDVVVPPGAEPRPPEAWLVNRLQVEEDDGSPTMEAIFSNYNDDIVLEMDSNTIAGRYDPARGLSQRLEIGNGLSVNKTTGTLYADLGAITKAYVDQEVAKQVAAIGDVMTGPLMLDFPWANIVLNVPDDTTAPVIIGQHAGKNRWQMQFGNANAAADFSLYAFDDPALNLKHVFNIARATGTAAFNYGLEVHGLGLYVTAPGATIHSAAISNSLTVAGATVLNGSATFNGPTTIVGTISGATAFSGAVTFNSSVNFGSRVAASVTDLSKHLSLYSSTYGFCITGGTLNLVADGVKQLSLTSTEGTFTGHIITGQELKLRQGTVGTIRFGSDDGQYVHWYGPGTTFMISNRLAVNGRLIATGSVHSNHAATAGQFRFGDENTDRYVYHDGTNTHWNLGGTMYMNVPLANVHSITSSGAISTPGANLAAAASYYYIGWAGGYGGAAEFRSGDASWDAYVTFHRVGAFACYFGLRPDNNFWFGGWSFGEGQLWRFWSTKDNGQMVSSVRTVHAGDTDHNDAVSAGVSEPFGATAVATGLGYSSSGGYVRVRYRYLQMFLANVGWVNIEAG